MELFSAVKRAKVTSCGREFDRNERKGSRRKGERVNISKEKRGRDDEEDIKESRGSRLGELGKNE